MIADCKGMRMRAVLLNRKTLIFLGLTLLFSLWPYFEMIRTGAMQTTSTLVLMWAPGLAALLTQWFTTRSVAGLGWRLGKPRYLLVSLLLPLSICVIVYGVLWGTGAVPFAGAALVQTVAENTGLHVSLPLAILLTAVVLFLPSLFTALGEEIGWRGLLVPELASRNNFMLTALISGLIWLIYHLPIVLFSDYHSSAPLWFGVPMFAISILSFSLIAAWLRLKSGSLWTGAILHASHNLFVQTVFDAMTMDFGLAPYLTTEFGAGLAVVYALVAFFYWRRRGELPSRLAHNVEYLAK